MSLEHLEDREVFQSWLFSLAVVQGAKERTLSGYPKFYVMHDTIAAGGEEIYDDIRVEQNEIWVLDALVHGDVLPDQFYLTIHVDDQPVMARQLLRDALMDMAFPVPFPMTGSVYIKAENTSTTDASLYQAVLWYRKFKRKTIETLFDALGIDLFTLE